MSWRRLTLALAAFLALGGLFYYDLQQRRGATVEKLAESRLIPPEIDGPEMIARIEIENRAADHPMNARLSIDLNLQPDEGELPEIRVREPFDRPADENVVLTSLLANLWRAKRSNVFIGEATAGNGLADPYIVARFMHSDPDVPSPLEVRIGERSNFTGSYFAWASDRPDEIFTVNEVVADKLNAPSVSYIDRRLIRIPGRHTDSKIKHIALENAFGQTVITADADGLELRHTTPDDAVTTGRVDPSVAVEFLRAVSSRGAASTIEPDEGLELGATYARLELSDGATTHSVTIGAKYPPDPQFRLAQRDDTDYFLLIKGTVSEELQLRPDHWSDRTLMPVDAGDVRRLVIAGPSGETVVSRAADGAAGWQFEGRPNRRLSAKKMEALLGRLCGLRADGVMSFSTDELRRQVRALYFSPKDMIYLADDGTTTHGLRIAATPEDGRFYAQRGSDTTIFYVALATGLDLRKSGDDLLDPLIFGASAEAAEHILFEGRETTATLRRDRSPLKPGWTADGLARESADRLARHVFELKSTTSLPSGHAARAGMNPDGKQHLYTISIHNAAGESLDWVEAYAPLEDGDQLQLRLRLADGTMLLTDRAEFNLMEQLVKRGSELVK